MKSIFKMASYIDAEQLNDEDSLRILNAALVLDLELSDAENIRDFDIVLVQEDYFEELKSELKPMVKIGNSLLGKAQEELGDLAIDIVPYVYPTNTVNAVFNRDIPDYRVVWSF